MSEKVKHTWGHRILAHKAETCVNGVYFSIHEVHYENDKPVMHTVHSIPPTGETIEDLIWALDKMKACCESPILWAGDKWPQEYKGKF